MSNTNSFCNCFNIIEPNVDINAGTPTNLSVANCNIPQFCSNNIIPFKTETAPVEKVGFQLYNPQSRMNFAPGYTKVTNGVGYQGTDPRLIDVARGGQVMILDVPPQSHEIDLSCIYNNSLKNYGDDYKTYTDVSYGDVLYYNDVSIEKPFFSPVFVNPSTVKGELMQTPMSSLEPQYKRFTQRENALITKRPKGSYGESGLSFIHDSQEQREDIISKQMSQINKQRWAPRWT